MAVAGRAIAERLVLGHFAFPQFGKADIWHGSCLKPFHNLDDRSAGGLRWTPEGRTLTAIVRILHSLRGENLP